MLFKRHAQLFLKYGSDIKTNVRSKFANGTYAWLFSSNCALTAASALLAYRTLEHIYISGPLRKTSTAVFVNGEQVSAAINRQRNMYDIGWVINKKILAENQQTFCDSECSESGGIGPIWNMADDEENKNVPYWICRRKTQHKIDIMKTKGTRIPVTPNKMTRLLSVNAIAVNMMQTAGHALAVAMAIAAKTASNTGRGDTKALFLFLCWTTVFLNETSIAAVRYKFCDVSNKAHALMATNHLARAGMVYREKSQSTNIWKRIIWVLMDTDARKQKWLSNAHNGIQYTFWDAELKEINKMIADKSLASNNMSAVVLFLSVLTVVCVCAPALAKSEITSILKTALPSVVISQLGLHVGVYMTYIEIADRLKKSADQGKEMNDGFHISDTEMLNPVHDTEYKAYRVLYKIRTHVTRYIFVPLWRRWLGNAKHDGKFIEDITSATSKEVDIKPERV